MYGDVAIVIFVSVIITRARGVLINQIGKTSAANVAISAIGIF